MIRSKDFLSQYGCGGGTNAALPAGRVQENLPWHVMGVHGL